MHIFCCEFFAARLSACLSPTVEFVNFAFLKNFECLVKIEIYHKTLITSLIFAWKQKDKKWQNADAKDKTGQKLTKFFVP